MNHVRFFLVSLALFVTACGNRVVDEKIADLGPEVSGVQPSEFHRPGQPCLLCHDEYLGRHPLMSVAGTIYAFPADKNPVPVKGATVTLTDAFGDQHTVGTNCAGNFHITTDDWQPAFPLRAEIEYPVPGSLDGTCAGCHVGAPNQGSPGWVTCAEADLNPPFPPEEADCPGAPR